MGKVSFLEPAEMNEIVGNERTGGYRDCRYRCEVELAVY